MENVPTPTTAFERQITALDGVNYVLEWRYAQRQDRWFLSLYSEDGTALVLGVKVVCNWPLLKNCRRPGMPPGDLLALSLTPDDSPPGFGEMSDGGRVAFLYVTGDEIAALGVTSR